MENETPIEQVTEEQEIDAIGKLKDEIATLKATTVSKEVYNKLKKAYVEGGSLSADEKEPSLADKKKEFKDTVLRLADNKQRTNLEHAQDLMRFRELSLDLYNKDPFLPSAGEVSQDDIEAYHRAAELYTYAIETAEGDTSVFDTAFGSKIKDVPGVQQKQNLVRRTN